MDMTATNRLRQLMTDPSSFKGTPGYQFGLDAGLQAFDRRNSAVRGTPGAALEAMKYATGYAQQDYGNEFNRLAQVMGQDQSYDLGQGQNANAATRNANDLALGHESNANQRYGIDSSTGLGYFNGMANYALGQGQNANTAQNNAWNYDLGRGRNANESASIFANYDLGQGRNAVDWYNAGTNRGSAQANAHNQGQVNRLAWYRAMPHGGTNPVTGGQWYNSGA